LYGAQAADQFFLHAWRIRFNSPATGKRVTVEAPLPEELGRWLGAII
jgi:23S rRNA-/tRNA-specific pseudouridylate synthase